MKTGKVLKLLARGIGAVAITAVSLYLQEEFAKGLIESIKEK